jgi:hypothetical protein
MYIMYVSPKRLTYWCTAGYSVSHLKIEGDLKIDRVGLSARATAIDLRRLGTYFCSCVFVWY